MSANPFVDEETADIFESAIGDIFDGAMITCTASERITGLWVTAAFTRIALSTDDHLTGTRALAWALASFVSDNFHFGDAGQPPTCGHEVCTDRAHIEIAFIDALIRDDLDAAMNVITALAKQNPEKQVEAICGFGASMIMSVTRTYLATPGPSE